MALVVRVGVCRFSYKLTNEFGLLEVQETFYNLLTINRARKWAEKISSETELSLKIFQGITHESKSPTWKRYKGNDFEDIKEYVGSLRLNEVTKKFWEHMFQLARILSSSVMLLQTPSSFKPSKTNMENVERTLEYINGLRRDINTILAWEPRGDWLKKENLEYIKKLVSEYEWLTHTTDIFFHEPIIGGKFAYLRLHGKPYLNYKYQYTREDFEELIRKIEGLESEGVESIYLLFNNVAMVNDAKDFKNLAKEKGIKVL